ncbi:MAG TPA: helicase-related protein, partial [Longimicrobiales bacterium]|nr:helicase-related protein [Longimicrobiales bacterium]
MDYVQWFSRVTGHTKPHPWQIELAASEGCADRLIRIPTGLGKTQGVLGAWAWHRLIQNDPLWPRRLVWCLPMRVLVEQTASAARALLARIRDEYAGQVPEVGVYLLMGGVDLEDWHLYPEQPAVLVGTQDMLLSRALNRGYAAGRARWPLEYGLLNHDCRWVMDDVQLMDVGLGTSVQLQAFRRELENRALRPCRTWWMSATLQPGWFETVDSRPWLSQVRSEMLRVRPADRIGPVWDARKRLTRITIPVGEDKDARALARAVVEAHQRARTGAGGRITLVIVNRVDTALSVGQTIRKLVGELDERPDVRVIHSRFRGLERRSWAEEFLSRSACEDPAANRIIVATQVVEAGVDISATTLVTELAPWPSLVQRFGRAGRYGGEAEVVVIDRKVGGKDALPYEESEIAAAREALQRLDDVGLEPLESLEASLERDNPKLLKALYPYDPPHLLTRRECFELFDTSPDLSGADLDISRFVRSGEERDVFVCWVPEAPGPEVQPARDGLCPVPVYTAKKWLFDGGSLKEGCEAWAWDYVEGVWRKPRVTDCYPGQVLLVHASWGGYDTALGFTGE